MSRKCKDWLETFMEWTVHRTEAHEHLLLWGGLFTLSSALRRRVVIPKSFLGSWEVYPYLYIIIVGPPGRPRKTTSMSFSNKLLRIVPGVQLANTSQTQQDLHEDIIKSADGSITIFSKEFSNFIAPSGPIMYDYLTGIFDGDVDLTYGTVGRGKRNAEKPCVNLLACTVPQFIAEMPISVIEGGFASRVIFIHVTDVRQRQFFYDSLIDLQRLSVIETKLKADLAYIANNVKGEFKFDNDETKGKIEQWYRDTADNFPLSDPRTFGYFERKPAHVLKVTMLLRIAYSDELIITFDDFIRALKIVEQTEKDLTKVFHAVGKNPYVATMDQITEFVKSRKKVPRKELLSRFYPFAPPQQLSELLGALIAMDKIRVEGEEMSIFYLPGANA